VCSDRRICMEQAEYWSKKVTFANRNVFLSDIRMNTFWKYIILCAAVMSFSFRATAQSKNSSVVEYGVKVEKKYRHDVGAYTQGLFFYNGEFYESTGQWGESSFRKVHLESGRILSVTDFPRNVFIEGSCAIGGYVFILTWTNHKCYMYDPVQMTKLAEFNNPREGWGLTTDGRCLIMSDGSSELFFMNPATFTPIRSVKVKLSGKEVSYLNELEYIDGKIWANVYTTDYILIIDPLTGVVEGRIDCRGLLPANMKTRDTDVLNGIAYNPADGGIYLTGKYWPELYKVSLVKK